MSEDNSKNILVIFSQTKILSNAAGLAITYFEQGLWFLVYLSFWGLLST